jgi:hypothetical protein
MSKAKPSNPLTLPQTPDQSSSAALACGALRPTVQAAVTIAQTAKPVFPDLALNELIKELSAQAKLAIGGDLGRMEVMLVAQSHTLDQLFNRLTSQALLNVGEYPQSAERYMKLALRAQAQCRANAEALQEMKHPKTVAFVQQANIANGPQQVNNGDSATHTRAGAHAGAGEIPSEPHKLLEQCHDERLDGATATQTGGSHQQMAAMEEIHRAKNG